MPLVVPVVSAGAKPLAKGLIRGYLALYDAVKEMVAEAGEQMSDLVAEAKAERAFRVHQAHMWFSSPRMWVCGRMGL